MPRKTCFPQLACRKLSPEEAPGLAMPTSVGVPIFVERAKGLILAAMVEYTIEHAGHDSAAGEEGQQRNTALLAIKEYRHHGQSLSFHHCDRALGPTVIVAGCLRTCKSDQFMLNAVMKKRDGHVEGVVECRCRRSLASARSESRAEYEVNLGKSRPHLYRVVWL